MHFIFPCVTYQNYSHTKTVSSEGRVSADNLKFHVHHVVEIRECGNHKFCIVATYLKYFVLVTCEIKGSKLALLYLEGVIPLCGKIIYLL